jgi:hypothetical protein
MVDEKHEPEGSYSGGGYIQTFLDSHKSLPKKKASHFRGQAKMLRFRQINKAKNLKKSISFW